jgi:glycosyltransferase involved in cell wall biosynthesis
MKVSVIMPCYLGEYDGCASDRQNKLIRAIHSFNIQTHPDRELIVISDGCIDTVLTANRFNLDNNIIIHQMKKQPLFSGRLRAKGNDLATGGIICYLDSDDVIGKTHLKTISDAFENDKKLDWIYFNDYVFKGDKEKRLMKIVELEHGSIGTSSIAHKKFKQSIFGKNISWKGCDGYGHDWTFIKKMIDSDLNYKKISGCDYNICHIPNVIDK